MKSSCHSDFISDNSSSEDEDLPQLSSLRERLARKRQLQEKSSFSKLTNEENLSSLSPKKVKCNKPKYKKDNTCSSNDYEGIKDVITLDTAEDCFETSASFVKSNYRCGFLTHDNHSQSAVYSKYCDEPFQESQVPSTGSVSTVASDSSNRENNAARKEKTTKATTKRSKEDVEENKRKAQVINMYVKTILHM